VIDSPGAVLWVVDSDAPVVPGDPATSHAAIKQTVGEAVGQGGR
jgi:hypothetical protein